MLCCGFRSSREEVDLVIQGSLICICILYVFVRTLGCVSIHGARSTVKSSLPQIPFVLFLCLDDSPRGNPSSSKASLLLPLVQ